jgi:hypothetical protein
MYKALPAIGADAVQCFLACSFVQLQDMHYSALGGKYPRHGLTYPAPTAGYHGNFSI